MLRWTFSTDEDGRRKHDFAMTVKWKIVQLSWKDEGITPELKYTE
jgi:hypothetical protein